MKIKDRAGDFRVRELLGDGYLRARGRYRVFRVTKRKRTSIEAAATLAEMLGIPAAEVGIAGLKDRQGVTTQFMSVPKGRALRWRTPELQIEPEGFADEPLTSAHSTGNEFEIVLRDVSRDELDRLVPALEAVRQHGVPNYYGLQRFGNLRYDQGWIARDLAAGRPEIALKAFLCSKSEQDNERNRQFKRALRSRWGDWRTCRDIAGKFGEFHSVFEHLARHADDFAGAFRYVSSRLRLIHLYAWQSHLWNRAVADYLFEITPRDERLIVDAPEGPLLFARGAMAIDPAMNGSFRVPGPRLTDVTHVRQRELLTTALHRDGIPPADYRIVGVSGFQLKGEDRALLVHPASLRMRPLRRTGVQDAVELVFDLPRGAYATVVVDRLLRVRAATGRSRPSSMRPIRAEHSDRDARPSRERETTNDDDAPRPRRPAPRGRKSTPRPTRRSPG
ncbi:MAG: tRNA pseudouridine(13) synthase TruD [Planctomycetota bacterium]